MKKVAVIRDLLIPVLFICFFTGVVHAEARVAAFVSIIPQAYFLERVGGPHVDVEVLVGEGQSPATYEPSPQQMAKLSSTKAYFAIGVPFEKNLIKKIRQSYKKLVIVETQKGVAYRYLEHHSHDHDAKGGRDHHDRVPDPHIWMDPKLVKVQATNIRDALCELDPANAEDYSKNLRLFISDLDQADKRIRAALAPVRGKSMYVFHPAFGYFADSYGLRQVSIEIEGKEPGAKQLATIIDKAKKEGVRVIFVQPQFSMKSAESVAREIGGAVVPINPLARDYLANLERMAASVEKGLR
ncbi:MAG: High-affinity zinc uptake system binding-protein ZnuA precursor [Syntrophorhabdaceae bacterium PtaU1.Bin034]|nr:MAG: High-affinity zinc uptake system binding-protein ZnuA precursor [Syntrophorhabdaceae bacterium PtaU1.Bin034]